MFFCFTFGCPTKDPPEPGRMCPRCNNASVVGASERMWFEFCFVPLIPFKKKHIWLCTICSWQMKKGDGYDPQPPSGHLASLPPPPQFEMQPKPGK